MSLGRNSFVPWVRQGLGNALTAPTGSNLRATAHVQLVIRGTGGTAPVSATIDKDIELLGPGDQVGIVSRQIVRTEPRHCVTDFEPNYVPFVEFYEEDFLWRYSPAIPSGARLQPWLALVVLTEDEHEFRPAGDRPLPYIEVTDPDKSLPDLAESWAWGHVHVNETLTGTAVQSNDETATTTALAAVLARNADLAYSRLVCPRKLEPKRRYHAYLVPAFESGRLAGLGLDVADAPSALHASWRQDYPGGARPEPLNVPVYHHWQFETSETGDFEYLVRLLKPRVADSRIGRRPIDVTDPSSNISGISAPFDSGVLRLGGALQVPFDTLPQAEKDVVTAFEEWDIPYPTLFQGELASFLNLGDAYSRQSAAQAHGDTALSIPAAELDDPLVLPPIYGQWHARVSRLLKDTSGGAVANDGNWVHEANLDPRHRATAAFGTRVVQRNQEGFMAAAWAQVGDVIAANRRLRFGQMGLATSIVWHQKHLAGMATMAPGRAVQTIYPMMRRLSAGPVTAKAKIAGSVVPPVVLSGAFRRATRPGGPVFKRARMGRALPAADMVTRIADGEVVAAPPKVTPAYIATPDDLPAGTDSGTIPAVKRNWLTISLMLLVVLILFVLGIWPLAILVAAGAAYLIRAQLRTAATPAGLGSGPVAPGAVARMPVSPDFTLADPFAAAPANEPTIRPVGLGSDSPELARYKLALAPLFAEDRVTERMAAVRPAAPIDIRRFATEMLAATHPAKVLPSKFASLIRLPEHVRVEQRETFAPVMAYPVFDTPMYRHLLDLSDEHFVPNLQYVAANSISLLETNQRFIEAYMLGLNHEFCRELLWREYPTDQRATSFRQFWDVSSFLDHSGKTPAALREELRDIPPIHTWPRASQLGGHDHRDRGGPAENELVLVIRGDLLKRYPTAVIYAHKARWQTKRDGSIDNTLERRLVELSAAQEADPPDTIVKTPLYEARANPDIYFLGFDLTALEARGDSGDDAGDDPGWFFVIKERPGEPRFGFDVERGSTDTAVWSDIAWSDVTLENATGFLRASQSLALTEPATTDERREQWLDDRQVGWTGATHSGDLAYILYQLPVMVAVHAADMLPRSTP